MTTRPVVIADEKDGAFNRVSAEHEGTIYPLLVPVLDTYVRTRCHHTSRGVVTLFDGEQMCVPCSEEVLDTIAKCVGSGDVQFNEVAAQALDDICLGIPKAAVEIWQSYGWNDGTYDDKVKATEQIAGLVREIASAIALGAAVQARTDKRKASLV